MNALTPTETKLFLRDDLDDQIDTFVGRLDPPDVREARKALLKARRWSTAAVSNPDAYGADAIAVHYTIVRVSSRWIYACLDTHRVVDAVAVCRRLAIAAGSLDRLECGHA